jgi:hypothetical protein
METQVRQLLQDVAEDIPPQRHVPPTLRGRARRRIIAVGATTLAVTAVLVAGGVGVVRSLSQPPVPVQPFPTPTPSAGASPTAGPAPLGDLQPVWPQTSLEEVRRAQELADAGDPRYTWQVDGGLEMYLGEHHPSDGRIFARFLQEKLGWEGYRWDEAAAHPDGLEDGDVVYIRCAPGGTNPLYPDDPDGTGCAPTIDETRYETVKIKVAQLGRHGPRGIWTVTGWEEIEPFEQIAPPSDAEIDATLGAFLQARVDGHGADAFDVAVDDPFASDPSTTDRVSHRIPLLYATSTEAPYERSEFHLVDGPVWPDGSEQFEGTLYAQNGTTVVRQAFSLERDETGHLRLGYDPMGLGGSGPSTTENGKAVPVEYGFLNGEVTYRAAYPAGPGMEEGDRGPDWVTVVGHCGKNEAGCSTTRRIMTILADPGPLGPDCQAGPTPTDAQALARSIRSDPDLQATAPVPVTIGGIPAMQVDVMLGPDAIVCLLKNAPFVQPGQDWARLYLLDLPGGSSRVLAIAICSSEEDHQRAPVVAAPYVDSIEFHARQQDRREGSS